MNVIDAFLDCDTNSFLNSFAKRQNSEILDEVIHDLEEPGQLQTALLGSPDPDISDLSLEDLINLDSNAHKGATETVFIDSANLDGAESDVASLVDGSLFDFIAADDTGPNNMSSKPMEYIESKQNSPTVDFAIDSTNKVCSYIDCMQQLFAPPSYEVVESSNVENPDFSSFINNVLSDCNKEMLVASSKVNSNDPVSETCDSETIFTSDREVLSSDSEVFDEISVVREGRKRPLALLEETEDIPAKRGKPSQEWNMIDHMILNPEMDKETVRKIKNNEASRVHRSKKKEKFKDLFKRKVDLEKSNVELQIKVEVMQREASLLRELLLAKMSNSSK